MYSSRRGFGNESQPNYAALLMEMLQRSSELIAQNCDPTDNSVNGNNTDDMKFLNEPAERSYPLLSQELQHQSSSSSELCNRPAPPPLVRGTPVRDSPPPAPRPTAPFGCHFCPSTFGSPTSAQRHAMHVHSSMTFVTNPMPTARPIDELSRSLDNSPMARSSGSGSPAVGGGGSNDVDWASVMLDSTVPQPSRSPMPVPPAPSVPHYPGRVGLQSPVWRYFVYRPEINKSECQLCEQALSGKYTSNLTKHLRCAHPDAYMTMRQQQGIINQDHDVTA